MCSVGRLAKNSAIISLLILVRPAIQAIYLSLRLSHLSTAGGTNLRVCLVTLQGDGKFEITQSKYRLTEEQKHEEGQALFDFCGECLKSFTDSSVENGTIEKDTVLPLGFTVSVP